MLLMPFDMPGFYNLRKSGREKQLQCYVRRLSQNYSPEDFSPEVRLERLKILETPEQENFKFYIKQDRIVRKHNKRHKTPAILYLLTFLLILCSLFLIYQNGGLKKHEFVPVRKIKKFHNTMIEYSAKVASYFEKFMYEFMKKPEVKEETSHSQSSELIGFLSVAQIKDVVRSFVAESNRESKTSKLPFPFVEDQCSVDSKPSLAEEFQGKKYRSHNSTYFECGDLTDYALASRGAKIINVFDIEPYGVYTYKHLGYLGSFLNYILLSKVNFLSANGPTSILIPWKKPGDCWAFKGSYGRIQIQLSEKVTVTAVTIDHIPRDMSPHKNVVSAPKKFSVFGIGNTENEISGQHLGSFEYKENGPPMQTFSVDVKTKNAVDVVELIIESNQGNEYTCLYKVRVHGYT